jgi:serine protease Do
MASDEILEIPQIPKRRGRWIIAVLCAVLLGVILGAMGVQFQRIPGMQGQPPNSFANVVEMVSPSVVSVIATRIVNNKSIREGNDWFTPPSPEEDNRRKSRGYGSGFVIDPRGIIATNYHVVETARHLAVRLWNGREYPAEFVGGDGETDVALIRVNGAPSLTPAKLGDSDQLRAGDWVMAMGNPFNYAHTVTVGVVSARHRLIEGLPFEQFIQTDAAINFGNSGGPLFNLRGEVVGMTTAISTRGRSIGFAIPINLANDIIGQLQQRGKVVRGYLGIRPAELAEELSSLLQVNSKAGIVVEDVSPGGGAALAGIQRYDVIAGINGQPIQDRQDFFIQVSRLRPGIQAQIDVLRNGKPYSAQVLIQERTVIPGSRLEKEEITAENDRREKVQQPWGIEVQDLPENYQATSTFGVERRGVFVTAVLPLSPAAELDLVPGDVILEVNRRAINSLKDYQINMMKTQQDRFVILLVSRPPSGTHLLVLKKSEN